MMKNICESQIVHYTINILKQALHKMGRGVFSRSLKLGPANNQKPIFSKNWNPDSSNKKTDPDIYIKNDRNAELKC